MTASDNRISALPLSDAHQIWPLWPRAGRTGRQGASDCTKFVAPVAPARRILFCTSRQTTLMRWILHPIAIARESHTRCQCLWRSRMSWQPTRFGNGWLQPLHIAPSDPMCPSRASRSRTSTRRRQDVVSFRDHLTWFVARSVIATTVCGLALALLESRPSAWESRQAYIYQSILLAL